MKTRATNKGAGAPAKDEDEVRLVEHVEVRNTKHVWVDTNHIEYPRNGKMVRVNVGGGVISCRDADQARVIAARLSLPLTPKERGTG